MRLFCLSFGGCTEGGDKPDPKGFSLYQGNTNVLIFEASQYAAELAK